MSDKPQSNGSVTGEVAVVETVTTGRSQRVRRQPKRWDDELVYGVPGSKKESWKIEDRPSPPKKTTTATRKVSTSSASKVKTLPPLVLPSRVEPTPPSAPKSDDDEGELQIDLPSASNELPVDSLDAPETDDNIDPENASPTIKVKLTAANIDSILGEDGDIFNLDEEIEPEQDSPEPEDDAAFEDSDDADYEEEEDPNKLWCLCRRPHDNRFMIACDSCEDWFHGDCVQISQFEGDLIIKQGRSWYCPPCDKGLKDGKSKEQLKQEAESRQKKLDYKAQKKTELKLKALSPDKRRRSSESSNQKHNKSLDSDPKKLRELIKQKKKDFANKSLPTVSEAVIKSSKSSTPNNETKNSSKPPPIPPLKLPKPKITNCLKCAKPVPADLLEKQKSRYCSDQCLTSLVEGQIESVAKLKKEKCKKLEKTYDPSKTGVVLLDRYTKKYLTRKEGINVENALTYIKEHPSYEVLVSSKDEIKESSKKKPEKVAQPPTPQPQTPTSPNKTKIERRRTNSFTKLEDSPSRVDVRETVRKGLKECFLDRIRTATDISMGDDEVNKLCNSIEEELFKYFSRDSSNPKYKNRYRSLLFNLKDVKNQGLWRKVITGSLTAARLVGMDAQELAGEELAKWREKELKQNIEAIKREQLVTKQRPIIKITHKGEEEVHNSVTKDEESGSKQLEEILSPTSSSAPRINNDKSKPPSTPGTPATPATPASAGTPSVNVLDSILGLTKKDTTAQHKQHLFDQNCKICMKEKSQGISRSASKPGLERRESTNSRASSGPDARQQPNKLTANHNSVKAEPKRIRIETDSASRILEEAARLTKETIHIPSSADSTPPPPPEAPKIIWSGGFEMTDVVKMEAAAYPISGDINFLKAGAMPNKVHVCGRIAPEQVKDYIVKLKKDTTIRTDILLVRFVPANSQHRYSYDSFFEYLNNRGRYGVVGNAPKSTVKDFYVFPLPRDRDVPSAFRPFNGPGIEERKNRPNLLLGLIVKRNEKDKKRRPETPTRTPEQETSQIKKSKYRASDDVSKTPPLPNEPSLTPPRYNPYFVATVDEPYDPEMSLTPPLDAPPVDDSLFPNPPTKKQVVASPAKPSHRKTSRHDDDEPYDPEKELPIEMKSNHSSSQNSPRKQSSSSSRGDAAIESLIDQIRRSDNPAELTNRALELISRSNNLKLHKLLLDQLEEKVQNQRSLLKKKMAEAEAAFAVAAGGSNSTTDDCIPGLGDEPSSSSNARSSPHESLNDLITRLKDIESQQNRLKAVSQACSTNDGSFTPPPPTSSTLPANAAADQEAVDMEIDEEDGEIVEQPAKAQPVSNSLDDLVLRARQHMAALQTQTLHKS